MKRKKAMAIVMVAAMTVTMLAGCGNSASDTAATPAAVLQLQTPGLIQRQTHQRIRGKL